MSDVSQGEGWWEASDGKWYPPEAVPGPDPDLTQRWDMDPSSGGPSSGGPAPFEPPSAGAPGPGGPPPGYGAPPAGPAPSFGAPAPGPGIPPGAPPNFGSPSQGSPGYAPPGGPPPGFGAPQPGAAPGAPPGYGAPSPAYGAPGPAGYGAPPQKKSNRTAWIILGSIVGGLVVLCGGCAAIIALTGDAVDDFDVSEVVTEAGYDFSNASPALGPSSCELTGIQTDGSGDYAVDAIVTSQADVQSHFRVDYDLFDNNGELLGSDFGIISDVEPGETVRDDTFGTIDATPDWTDVTCNVTSAIRTAS